MGRGRFRSIIVSEGESDLWIGWNGGLLTGPGSKQQPGGQAEPGGPLSEVLAGTEVPTQKVLQSDPLEQEIRRQAAALLHRLRANIQEYTKVHPDFLTSLDPLPADPDAPEPVRSMLTAALAAGVGPMAAVAGAIAEALGRALQDHFHFNELVIENGGDYWLLVQEPLPVLVYAGLSSLSEKVSVVVAPEQSPCGLACSSGTVGPSLSFGKADAALVLAPAAAAADAWATALGNRLRFQSDLAPAVEELINGTKVPPLVTHTAHRGTVDPMAMAAYNYLWDEGTTAPTAKAAYYPLGALAIMGDKLAACGAIRLG